MQYRVYDIRYDTDGENVQLPEELMLDLDEGEDASLVLADKISDETGYLVEGFRFEEAAPAMAR